MKRRNGSNFFSEAGKTLSSLLRTVIVRNGNHHKHPSLPGKDAQLEREFLEMLSSSQATIFMVCLHFTDRQPDSIRDLYQEIVITLWEAWPDFRGQSASNTWVRRIALNVAASAARVEMRKPRLVPLEDWMLDSIAEETVNSPPDYYKIIDSLEPDERALIYLRLDQLSLSDIAEVLGTTEGAVKTRFLRLRKKIDDLKTKYENE